MKHTKNNSKVEGSGNKKWQVKDEAETNETNKPDGNVNSDGPSRPSDSDLSSNAKLSKDEEIALIFRKANDKLDKIEANAEKEKQQVVREAAQKLEKILPMDKISSEVVKGFRERISPSTIYAALEEKYKISYRVQNARKRKKGKEKKTESSAPTSELKQKKQIIIDTSGHSTQQPVGEPYSSDDGDNNKPQEQRGITQNSKSVTIHETEGVGSGISTDASPPQPSDKYIGQECPSCLELQDEVIQLREALKHTSMRTADEIPRSEFKCIIPKEKHKMVIDAMDRSKSAIFVICDESKKFVGVLADVDN